MMTTPDLPAFASLFAKELQKLRAATQAAIHQFQALFEPWIPHYRLAQQEEGPHSRNRRWNLRLVFWTFLWQIAQAGASCREAIDQAHNLCLLQKRPQPNPPTAPAPTAKPALTSLSSSSSPPCSIATLTPYMRSPNSICAAGRWN
ncbi:MAG: hypothetical protein KA191_01990 [Verrucomicrobia bacterium]|nr:hypothetical protein [Verrucomicrobiota bacterium]OQC62725.1 MAG: hypothetical protein BWX48_03491 [Verrucomicrobia bacterium ADurb.Bin006]NMD19340.1 hypothetical protein [Verrucomicrobiota bacterium]HOA60756.1 hypothetical protein [Verrucomicrobiota bacterium]HOF46934.1 hypothetical protein [Verrucomicrobiota bacterium]